MLILEQLLDQIERLPARARQKLATHCGTRQQVLALALRQRLSETLRQENARRDGFSPAVPFAECLGVARRKTRDIGERLVEIATKHERGPIALRLAELVARRDVSDLVGKPQVLEPRRLGDMKMIDRMQIVMEAGLGHLLRGEPAAIAEPAFHRKNLETGFGEIAAQDQAVMAGTD